MSTMQVDIVTPDRKLFSEQANMVIARTLEGEIGILPRHVPLAAVLQISKVRVKKADGDEVIASVSGGFMEVRPEGVTVLAEAAEFPEDIDVDRAKAAKERAEKRLRERQEDIDFRRAEMALQRALNRLDIVDRQD